jgi:hypothetical protein
MGDEKKAAAESIIAKCDNESELDGHIIYHATVAIYLVCHKAKLIGQDEAAIRCLYSVWADMAVKEFTGGYPLNRKSSH